MLDANEKDVLELISPDQLVFNHLKFVEEALEAGELIQKAAMGRYISRDRIEEELGDLLARLIIVMHHYDPEEIMDRCDRKITRAREKKRSRE